MPGQHSVLVEHFFQAMRRYEDGFQEPEIAGHPTKTEFLADLRSFLEATRFTEVNDAIAKAVIHELQELELQRIWLLANFHQLQDADTDRIDWGFLERFNDGGGDHQTGVAAWTKSLRQELDAGPTVADFVDRYYAYEWNVFSLFELIFLTAEQMKTSTAEVKFKPRLNLV